MPWLLWLAWPRTYVTNISVRHFDTHSRMRHRQSTINHKKAPPFITGEALERTTGAGLESLHIKETSDTLVIVDSSNTFT